MLHDFSIRNFELIDHIETSFHEGLNVITGETGTGKSMILSALHLICGGRGSDKVVKDSQEKCILEASFAMTPSIKHALSTMDLDIDDKLYLRREFNAQGRTRSFVNDSPVNLDILRKLSTHLIDIHSQDQTSEINQNEYQLDLLDVYCEMDVQLASYQKLFFEYEEISLEIDRLKKKAQKDKEEKDFLQFQFDELTAASLLEGEIKSLEAEKELLAKEEEIKNALSFSLHTLQTNDPNVLEHLYDLKQRFESLSEISSWLSEISKRLNESYGELKDLAYEAEARLDNLDASSKSLEEIEERLHTYYSLENKFKVHGDLELIQLKETFKNRLESIDHIDEDINALINKQNELFNQLNIQGGEISKIRKKKSIAFTKDIEKQLKQLGINHPQTPFKIEDLSKPNAKGFDHVQFLFSSNKDQSARPIEEVASGGERSRVMLAIKSIIGNKRKINSMVFDEIDTGISGEVAIKTGELLSKIGISNQVISITHLPQVASKGNTHYKVDKEVVSNRTNVSMKLLSRENRVKELAEMLGGKSYSQSARETAEQLLR